jgi:hypothetical protein
VETPSTQPEKATLKDSLTEALMQNPSKVIDEFAIGHQLGDLTSLCNAYFTV